MTLGEIIKSYRTENKISMDDFARQSGISKAYISILERNINPISGKPPIPSLDKIRSAGSAMGYGLDEMLARMGDGEAVSLQTDVSVKLPMPNITEDVVTFPIVTSVAAHYDSISYDETLKGIPLIFLANT
ncbi:XRE family transcriptional regulator [Clostridiaceae bacterium]|nr:XRE family transcriptional regulator [Clostridiaceae bacterium]